MTQLHPKVEKLADQYNLNNSITKKLDDVLQKRRKTFDADLLQLSLALEKSSNPVASLITKIRELEEGDVDLSAYPDKDVEKMVEKFGLDQKTMSELAGVMRGRSDKRSLIEALGKHLDRSRNPKDLAPELIEKIRNGEDLGDPPKEARHDQDRARDYDRERNRDYRVNRDNRDRDNRDRDNRDRDNCQRDNRDRDRGRDRDDPPWRPQTRSSYRSSGRESHRDRDSDRGRRSDNDSQAEVKAYIKEHRLDDCAAEALLSCPVSIQRKVMERGIAQKMSPVVMARIKEARMEMNGEKPKGGGKGGGKGGSRKGGSSGGGRSARDDSRDRRGSDRRNDRDNRGDQREDRRDDRGKKSDRDRKRSRSRSRS